MFQQKVAYAMGALALIFSFSIPNPTFATSKGDWCLHNYWMDLHWSDYYVGQYTCEGIEHAKSIYQRKNMAQLDRVLDASIIAGYLCFAPFADLFSAVPHTLLERRREYNKFNYGGTYNLMVKLQMLADTLTDSRAIGNQYGIRFIDWEKDKIDKFYQSCVQGEEGKFWGDPSEQIVKEFFDKSDDMQSNNAYQYLIASEDFQDFKKSTGIQDDKEFAQALFERYLFRDYFCGEDHYELLTLEQLKNRFNTVSEL